MPRILIWTMLSRPLSWRMTWTWTPSYLALIVPALLAKVSSCVRLLWTESRLLQDSHMLQMSVSQNIACYRPYQCCKIVFCMPEMLLACSCNMQGSLQLWDQLPLLVLCC